jgi:hypothetical protein
MLGGLRGLAATATSIVGLALLTPGSALAGTLDQQQTDGSGPPLLISPDSVAESFTAGLGGGIDQVDLYLGKISSPTAPLIVEIRNVSGGTPGSVTLASANALASGVPTSPAFVAIHFAVPALVSPGTQYAIVAYSSTSGGNEYTWYRSGSTPDPYPGGVLFVSSTTPPSTWVPSPTVDLAFKTYVATPVATPAPPTGQRAAALKKCKKKHSKKAKKKCRKRASLLPV